MFFVDILAFKNLSLINFSCQISDDEVGVGVPWKVQLEQPSPNGDATMEAAALALPTHPPCWIWWEYSQWPQECFR
jgi:hypothetical protein